jgi:hypothetical protein
MLQVSAWTRRLLIVVAGLMVSAVVGSGAARADVFWVNFDDPSFSINDGTAGSTFGYHNDSASVVSFNTISNFGIGPMAGGDRVVMQFPLFSGSQGLVFNPNVAANGGGTFLNQYTMMWDLYFDEATVGPWMSLYQTNATNTNDGELFIRNSDRGLGISGVYGGRVELNEWNRVGVTVDLSLDGARMRKFINGVFVGTNTLAGVDGRWSMYRQELGGANYLLTDDNGETSAGFISAFYFENRALSDTEMSAWGGAKAIGFSAVPEPSSAGLLTAVAAAGLAFRRRRR